MIRRSRQIPISSSIYRLSSIGSSDESLGFDLMHAKYDCVGKLKHLFPSYLMNGRWISLT